jgi:hypothetical protein
MRQRRLGAPILALLVGMIVLLSTTDAVASTGRIIRAYADVTGARGDLTASVTWTGCGSQTVYGPHGEAIVVPLHCKWHATLIVGELNDYAECPTSPKWPAALVGKTIPNPEGERWTDEGPDINGTMRFAHHQLPDGWQSPCLYLVGADGEPHFYNECEESGLPAEWCPTKEIPPTKTILARARLRLRSSQRQRCHLVPGWGPGAGGRSHVGCNNRREQR